MTECFLCVAPWDRAHREMGMNPLPTMQSRCCKCMVPGMRQVLCGISQMMTEYSWEEQFW